MATVRITKDLIAETLIRAERQFKPLVEKAEASRPDSMKWGMVILQD